MSEKSTEIIRRIDDLGRITIPRELRRKLKVRENDAFEIGITSIDGKNAFYLLPYDPIEVGIRKQLADALLALARQLPNGYEVGLLGESGTIANTNTGRETGAMNIWKTVEDEVHWMLSELCGRKEYGYRQIDGKDVLYYPVSSYGEVIFVLAIAGNEVCDDVAGIVRATAGVLSAMLS